MTLEQAIGREEPPEDVLGELAHELSLLVRSELEAARNDDRGCTGSPSSLRLHSGGSSQPDDEPQAQA